MLQVETVTTRVPPPAQQAQARQDPSPAPGIGPSGSGISNQRFSFDKFEQELTFTPKLNATSLRLAHERRAQLKSGVLHRAHARVARLVSTSHHIVNPERPHQLHDEFTFKPQMSTASLRIAEGLGTTFMARQEMHLQKQRKMLEQNTKLPLRGRLSPVPSIAKARRLSVKEKENSEISQLAWGTPSSTPNLTDAKEQLSGDSLAASKRLTAGSTSSLLNPVRPGRSNAPMQTSVSLNKLVDNPLAHSTANMLSKRHKGLPKAKHLTHKRGFTHPSDGRSSQIEEDSEQINATPANNHNRSKTNTSPELSPRAKGKNAASRQQQHNGERLRIAKLTAEKAVKSKKIFTIQGPYPVVRACLRRRSWVEKQYRMMNPHKFDKNKGTTWHNSEDESDSDDDDDDDNACDDDNADDDSGLGDSDSVYGIMSRIVRNSTPTFIWTVKKGSIDYKFLRKDTIVNHFSKNGTFTTKVGLCTTLKLLPWYDQIDQNTFFPRCYRICADEEKESFVDDYRLTAATSVLKWIIMKQDGDLDIDLSGDRENEKENKESENKQNNNGRSSKNKKEPVVLGTKFVDVAVKVVEHYLTSKEHDDIDSGVAPAPVLTDEQWTEFLQQYYQLVSEGGRIDDTTTHYAYCDSLLNRLRVTVPQLDMGGIKNIWIVKPGAKSRGRGILCMNKLEEIMKLVGNPIVKKEGKWVVQKYIERPLLIYNTKFDIRQWFLVTDWNPLTIWWYDACYLRFCTQPFSLDKLDQSIHLSNFSIQKNYDNDPTRDKNLPKDNMWDNHMFKEYLESRGYNGLWDDLIVPGMKKAVVCSMQCAQDVIEGRKNSFELYGADFMLTDDFLPWLIEINASPAMGATSPITEQLCADVIEDTMKVVLDRKHDKNCDTGRFQLLYKGPSVSVPPYIGAALAVDGISIRKPASLTKQKSTTNISPRYDNDKKSAEPSQLRLQNRSKTPGRAEKMSSLEKLGLKSAATPKATNMEEMKRKLAGIDALRVFDTKCVSGSNSGTNGFLGSRLKKKTGKRTKSKSEGSQTKHIRLPSLQYKPTGETGREELKPTPVTVKSAGSRGHENIDGKTKNASQTNESTVCDDCNQEIKRYKVTKGSPIHGNFPKRDLPRTRIPTVGEYTIKTQKHKVGDTEGVLVKRIRAGAVRPKLKLQHHDVLQGNVSIARSLTTISRESWCSSSV